MCGIPELARTPSWQGAAERQAARRASRAKKGGISFDKFVDRPLPPVAAKPASPKAVQRPRPAPEKPLLRVATPQRKAAAANNAVKRAKAAADCVFEKSSKKRSEIAAEKAEAAQVKAQED